MKKILFLTLLSISSIFASEYYTEVSYEQISPEKDVVLGIQPTEELIGGDLDIYKFSVGFSVPKDSNQLAGSKFGFYGTYSNSEEKDISGGIDFTIENRSFNFLGITPYFGGNLGIGLRNDEGIVRETSTHVNKYNYITTEDLNTLRGTDYATFEKDTTWVEYGFSLGLEYRVGDLSIKGAYLYQHRTYEVAYRLESSQNILNSLDINQRYNGFELSVAYRF